MTSNTPPNEKRILLVEDEPTYRTLILLILRRAGINCTFCVDGDHAIQKLTQEKFDLLILDYLLPGPNGVEIVRSARKQGIDIPALIITNYPSDALNEITKSLGRTKVLAKPSFEMANLPAIVLEMMTS